MCFFVKINTKEGEMLNILIAEDNEDLNNLISNELKRQNFNVFSARDGDEALTIYEKNHIDLLVTDIMMPNIDGFSLIEYIRKTNNAMPILIMSAKSTQADKYKGFKLGTDDYMTKPIDIDELILRINALLRRAKISTEQKITIGNAVLNYETYTVTLDGKAITLPQKEFQILFKLLSYPDKIFTRTQLMDEIWGIYSDSDEMTVYTHVHRLREKFSNCPYFEIVTLRNLGYKAVIK